MKTTLETRYTEALRKLPSPGAGCHGALMGVANLGVMNGLSESVLLGDIRSSIPSGHRRVADREILDAIHKAQSECKVTSAGHAPRTQRRRPQEARKPFDGPKYRQNLIERSRGVSDADLWELSPYRITWEPGPMDALHLLDTLYAPAEILLIGDTYSTTLHTVAEWRDIIAKGKTSPQIIINPLTGREHSKKGGDGMTRRGDNCVESYRFALVEFDDMPMSDQLCFWHSIITGKLLPVSALIDSGNKSIHAWLRVDLPDAAAWQWEIRDTLYHPQTGRMTLLGADPQCKNESRMSRLPGHFRQEKQRLQRLLYLNPTIGGNS
jgi:hypothetical protein